MHMLTFFKTNSTKHLKKQRIKDSLKKFQKQINLVNTKYAYAYMHMNFYQYAHKKIVFFLKKSTNMLVYMRFRDFVKKIEKKLFLYVVCICIYLHEFSPICTKKSLFFLEFF